MSKIDDVIKERNLKPKEKIKYKEIIRKDERGNIIQRRYPTGSEWLSDYDSNNNLIYFRDIEGNKSWFEYDKNNNLIHYLSSSGYEYWVEYDENGVETRRLKYVNGDYYLNSKYLARGVKL